MSVISIFIAYSSADADYLGGIRKVLNSINGSKGSSKVIAWCDREILPGVEWDKKIRKELEDAKIILLLVSLDFLATDYCTDIEVKRAMERHDSSDALVIPIIVRECDWKDRPFSKLNALPRKGNPINGTNPDKAYSEISEGLKEAIKSIQSQETQPQLNPRPKRPSASEPSNGEELIADAQDDKRILSSKDEFMARLTIWVSNVHQYRGVTENDLRPVYEEVIEILPSLTEMDMILCLRDENIHFQFRGLLKDTFPGYSDQHWPLDWTFKLFLFLRSKRFSEVVSTRKIPENVRSKLRSHIDQYRVTDL